MQGVAQGGYSKPGKAVVSVNTGVMHLGCRANFVPKNRMATFSTEMTLSEATQTTSVKVFSVWWNYPVLQKRKT